MNLLYNTPELSTLTFGIIRDPLRGALGSGQNGRVDDLEAGRPKARQLIFTRRSDFGPDPTVAGGNHITPYKFLLFT